MGLNNANDEDCFPIWVIKNIMSDGSEVFDVEIGGQVVPANSEKDAYDLAEKISEAIEAHSNTSSSVLQGGAL